MNTINTLTPVTETATNLKALRDVRDKAMKARDSAAWSLHVHGDNGTPWTHTAILALFGTASHDPWTKSRKRMRDLYDVRDDNGNLIQTGTPPRIEGAEEALKAAVTIIRDTDTKLPDAERAYSDAVLKAVEGGASQSAVAAAAGVKRQAVNAMLKRELAA